MREDGSHIDCRIAAHLFTATPSTLYNFTFTSSILPFIIYTYTLLPLMTE